MHAGFCRIAVATSLAFASGSACAMSEGAPQVHCHVVNGGKLSKESGGADALCRALRAAMDARSPREAYNVEVTVLGPSRLSAKVTSGSGKEVAEQNYGSMDRDLTASSFERFAASLVAAIFDAGK